MTQIKSALNGKQINLTGDNTTITSNNFKVDKNGNMTCTNANVSGNISSNNIKVTGGKIKLIGGTRDDPNFSVEQDDYRAYITPDNLNLTSLTGGKEFSVGLNQIPMFRIQGDNTSFYFYDNLNELDISVNNAYLIGVWHAQNYLYDSLESKKKNISMFDANAIDIIKKSDIYKYNFKTEKDSFKRHIGLIIGENYNTPKELTSNNNDGIDLYSMVSVAYKAIQEQQSIIEEQNKTIEKQNKTIEDLLSRVEKLEKAGEA